MASQAVATTQIGVREWPGQPDRGAQVDQYLQTAGIANPGSNPPDGDPWCQAFLYWCAVQACHALGRPDVPVPRTAGGREGVGVGVGRLDRRKLTEDKLKGFVDFGAA